MKKIMIEMEESMKKSIDKLKGELATMRTGRANPSLLEGVKVEYYGSVMPINQVAGVSVPEARTIEIKPWDPTVIPAIEKAIHVADIGVTPMNDGKTIRLNLPALTQERRQELVKLTKKFGEEYKISVRNSRREAIEDLKKAQKEKLLSEDEEKSSEHEVQKVTNTYIKKIDDILAVKEKEIMEV